MELRKLPNLQNKKVLFIISQAGQASFFNPLWKKWLEAESPCYDFKIWASPDAQSLMSREAIKFCLQSWQDEAAIIKFRPELIISSACGEKQEVIAANYAIENYCKHVQLIDTFYGYKSRIEASNPVHYRPDYIWLIHDIALKEAIDEGCDRNALDIVGHPYFEKIIKNPVHKKAAEGSVVFVSQPISQIHGLKEDLGYDENDIWECLRDIKAESPDLIKKLIYARHPAQRTSPTLKKNERLLGASENSFDVAETMIGMFSTIMVEAYLKGQNVISLQCGLKTQNKDILSRKGFIQLIECKNGGEDFKKAYQKRTREKNLLFQKPFEKSLLKIENAISKLLV